MSNYLYELPTTGAISFADFCVDQTPNRCYTTHISDATQARANVRSELKENKRSGRDEKDYLKLVKVRVLPSRVISLIRRDPGADSCLLLLDAYLMTLGS
jgi:hypothetical protein